MVQLNKMCVIRDKQVINPKCVGRPITTQTIPANNPCVLAGKQLSAIEEIITDGFRSLIRVRCDLLSLHNIYALCVQNNIIL